MDSNTQTAIPAIPAVSGKIITIHTRKQHSRGSSAHRFGGPDTYVAVTIDPNGVGLSCYALRRDILAKRGIQIVYCGEGYSQHSGPRSALGRAYAAAQQIAARG